MTTLARMDSVCDRDRMIELSYSLYECLSDLITDCESLPHATTDDIDGLVERISISSMNCLADMRLLSPMFSALETIRYK